MNIVNKLTLRHLKENKGRTIVTTLGICVSVAMITAVFVALASFMNLFGEVELISSGQYHAAMSTTADRVQALQGDDRVAEVGVSSPAGYSASYRLAERRSDAAGTGDFCTGDSTYIRQMVTGKYDGTLPAKRGEIAVEQRLIDRNALAWSIGDTVTIPTGRRVITDDSGTFDTNGAYTGGEKFRTAGDEQFTITAILHNNPATIGRGCSIVLCSVDAAHPLAGDTPVDATVALRKVDHHAMQVIRDIANQNNVQDYQVDSNYLCTHFAFGDDNTLLISLLSVTAVILVIIMIASVVLIYNAFAMSISERVRYLGMLASVGATRQQKRLSVYFESLMLGAIGIPVGLAAGISGIGITLRLLGDRIISSNMILGVSDSGLSMRVIVSPWVIAGIVIISTLTIFISSYIPARKASRITPIDALRSSNDIRIRARRLRSSVLVRAIFGYEGELANKNLKRNDRKSRIITASIALSVILFISCNTFCSMFTQSVDVSADMPYQVSVTVNASDRDRLCSILDDMADVDDHYSVTSRFTYLDKSTAPQTSIGNSDNYTRAYKKLLRDGIPISCNAINDADFDALCRANGIDSRQYYGDDYRVLLLNNITHRKGDRVFTDRVVGVSLDGVMEDRPDAMTIGGTVQYDADNYVCNLSPRNTITLYEPLSQYLRFANGDARTTCVEGICTTKHTEVADTVRDSLISADFATHYVTDNVDSYQTMNTIAFILQVLVYGFISLISLITIFNIINTISTGVTMRRKEFAMLKSVGTTPSGFNRMIMLESAFYGIKALIFALPISLGISYLLYLMLDVSTLTFGISWGLYLGVIAAVLLLTGGTMLYSVHKLRDDSIVATLKQDII